MKMIIFFVIFVVMVTGAPPYSNVVVIKDFPLNNNGVDNYDFGFELSDGQTRREFGKVENAGTKKEALFVEGSFSFFDPASKSWYVTTYTADENGYHPVTSQISA